MYPAQYDMTVLRGGTFESGDISREVEGVTLNFAQYTGMALRIKTAWKHTETTTTEDPLLELTMADGYVVVAGDELSISVVIPASETADLAFESGRYFLDLYKEVEGVPVVDKLLYGKFTVIGEDDI